MSGMARPVAAEGAPERLLMIPFGFFDTSGEPRDQRAEHASRLAAMARELSSNLESSGLYEIVRLPQGTARCGQGETACILDQARTAGADLVLAGAVQKVSTMASSVWIGAFEAASGKRVFYRQLSFRGDTDEAWHHAAVFIAGEIRDDPPRAH